MRVTADSVTCDVTIESIEGIVSEEMIAEILELKRPEPLDLQPTEPLGVWGASTAGLTPDEVIHDILVQWATSGSEALMATSPLALRQLKEAADAGDTEKVRGILSWLLSGA